MDQYVGLDVSLKSTAICVVDAKGKIMRKGPVGPRRHFERHRGGSGAL